MVITKQMLMLGGAGAVSIAVVGGLVSTIRSEPPPAPAVVVAAPSGPAPQAPAPSAAKPGETASPSAAEPAPKKAEAAPVDPNAPKFDVVRVEPSGETLVAGTGQPGAAVRLRAGEKIIAQGKVGPGGDFVLLPEALAPGDYLLSLETAAGASAAVTSAQSVSVSVPRAAKGEVIVALTEPDKPTQLLSDAVKTAVAKPPDPAAAVVASVPPSALPAPGAPTAPAGPRLAIRTVEVEDSGAFFATGAAPAGSYVRLYLNDAFVADVTAAPDGRWSLKVERGMQPGQYAVRTDEVDRVSGAVSARAEVAFVYPQRAAPALVPIPVPPPAPPRIASGTIGVSAIVAATPEVKTEAAATTPEPAPPPAPASAASNAVVETIATAKVSSGDSLWRISRHVYGRGIRYTQIFNANTGQIRDPHRIFPGQILVVPKSGLN